MNKTETPERCFAHELLIANALVAHSVNFAQGPIFCDTSWDNDVVKQMWSTAEGRVAAMAWNDECVFEVRAALEGNEPTSVHAMAFSGKLALLAGRFERVAGQSAASNALAVFRKTLHAELQLLPAFQGVLLNRVKPAQVRAAAFVPLWEPGAQPSDANGIFCIVGSFDTIGASGAAAQGVATLQVTDTAIGSLKPLAVSFQRSFTSAPAQLNAVTGYSFLGNVWNLYIGGQFDSADEVPGTANVMRYSSSGGVSALGGGVNGVVRCLHSESAKFVVAGGHFTLVEQSDGSPLAASRVAIYSRLGATGALRWSALGSGLQGGDAYALHYRSETRLNAYGGRVGHLGVLYVAGSFTSAGRVPHTAGIAAWKNGLWRAVSGAPAPAALLGLAVCSGELMREALHSTALAWDSSGRLWTDGDPPPCGPPSCPTDLVGNGDTGVESLAILLASWGTCPVRTY